MSNPVTTLGIESFGVIQVSLQHKINGELQVSKSHWEISEIFEKYFEHCDEQL